jgi:iron complex outermembrane receptor protein
MTANSGSPRPTGPWRQASRFRALLLSTAALASGLAVPALAQTAPAAAASPDSPSASVGEVIVTARRRSENLEKVPVAITAYGAQDLVRRQIATQTDLQQSTPGLIVRETQNRNQQNYSIRGESIDAYSQSQPGVLTYVNEFQNPVVSAAGFYDLSSIQVLKGPQGTLFGRNTTGGAVLITTQSPLLNDFDGYFDASFGNYDLRKEEAAINLPVTDTFAVRIAGMSIRRDGYVHNRITGQDDAQTDDDSVRFSALWRPDARFENSLELQYDRGGGRGDPAELYSVNAPGQKGPAPDNLPLNSTAATFFGPGLDALAGPGAYAALQKVTPGAPAGGILQFAAIQRAAGPWVDWDNSPLNHRSTGFSVADTTTYKISDSLQIKNIIGYVQNRNADGSDVEGSPFAVVNDIIENDAEQFSDEFQLSGRLLSDNLVYVAGFYYSHSRSEQVQTFTFLDLGPVADPLFHFPASNIIRGVTTDDTEGVFGQGTYKLDQFVPGLSVTLGVRYTLEQIRFTEVAGFTGFFPPDVREGRDDSNPSWNVGLEYQVNKNLLLYVTQRGSWRSGGFNQSAPPVPQSATGGGNEFMPETTRDVELGAKFDGELAGMHARLNVAAYNQWVDSVQRVLYITLPSGLTALTVNVPGGAEFHGVEVDGALQPAPWLDVGATFAYTDGSYGTPHAVRVFGAYADFDTLADISRFTGSAYAQATVPVPDRWGQAYLRGDVYAQDGQYFSSTGKSSAPNTFIPGYALLNFKAGINNIDGTRLSVSLFVKNALDKKYYAGGITDSELLGYSSVAPGQPRFYGIEIGYRF